MGVCSNGSELYRVPRSAYPAALKLAKDKIFSTDASLMHKTGILRASNGPAA